MRFDSNLAWREATAAVSAHRDIVLVLAGVFFLLPSLAFSLLFPQPQPEPGMTPDQMMELAGTYYTNAWPMILMAAAAQLVGTLAVLALFTDRTRPTVGQAIGQGLAGAPSCLAAQVLLGLGLGLVFVLVIGIASQLGSPVLAVVAGLMCVIGFVYCAIRTSLVAPVVGVDRVRNPVTALRRSWMLTKGNAGRIALFFVLLLVAVVLVLGIVMALIGLVLALVAGQETARIIAAVISSALTAVITLYFIAVLASVHRQLSGPSPEAVSAAFE